MRSVSHAKNRDKKWLLSKSLWKSPAIEDFYGTGIEIWAGFGPVGITEQKTFDQIMRNFWAFIKFSWSKKILKIKNIVGGH